MIDRLSSVRGRQVGVSTMLKADKKKLSSLSCYLSRAKTPDLAIYANLVRCFECAVNLDGISVTVSINSVSSKLLGL